MRIVRLANFVAPHSGGLRVALAELGAGYLAAGHEPVLVIPGERDSDGQTPQGRVITLRAPRVPFTGGYRVLWRRRRLARLAADPALRAAFGAAGRRTVTGRSWPALTEELLGHYSQVLGTPKRAKVTL